MKANKIVRLKAYICVHCEGLYAEPVTQCDCNSEVQKFYSGVVTFSRKRKISPQNQQTQTE